MVLATIPEYQTMVSTCLQLQAHDLEVTTLEQNVRENEEINRFDREENQMIGSTIEAIQMDLRNRENAITARENAVTDREHAMIAEREKHQRDLKAEQDETKRFRFMFLFFRQKINENIPRNSDRILRQIRDENSQLRERVRNYEEVEARQRTLREFIAQHHGTPLWNEMMGEE